MLRTAIDLFTLVATLGGCHASRERSAPPQRDAPVPSPRIPKSPATAADFDIGPILAALDPIELCKGSEVVWGGRCTSSPDVLAQLAAFHPIPADLRACGPSLLACQHARMLCGLAGETLVGDGGETISVAELADALYTYGENGLSYKCSVQYRGACEDLRGYPQAAPHCSQ